MSRDYSWWEWLTPTPYVDKGRSLFGLGTSKYAWGDYRNITNFWDRYEKPGSNSPDPTTSNDSANAMALLQDDRKWSEQQAQKQMDFQREMSNTSWQRGVKDMQAAGLNPYLAYTQGGASTAQGASGNTSSTAQGAFIDYAKMNLERDITRENNMFKLLTTAIGLFKR